MISKAPQLRTALRYIPSDKLFVSEPVPRMFGNPPNKRTENWTNDNWLKSRFHFSFAEYNNFGNSNYGVLRVMNDDLVQPKRGFGTHGHRNMEIVTYVVQGKLSHQDSLGTKESLGRGSIQFMTAGTGVAHSETNDDQEPLRFIQMWLLPTSNGLKPNYGSMCGDNLDLTNKFAHLVSSVESSRDTPVKINCDANIQVAEISKGKTVEIDLKEGRQAYFLAVEGNPVISGSFGKQSFKQHDAAELKGGESFIVQGPGHVLVVEMAEAEGGRTDL
ncbi:hypothetical protein AAMO2058_000861100 [Amorphochlora amoebiformis]